MVFPNDSNQRYKLLKTKPKDINITASYQSNMDFVYSAYKINQISKNLAHEIISTIFRGKC